MHIPIGAGNVSLPLRSLSEACPTLVTDKDWVVFQGYIESENLAGEKFEDGFAVVFSIAHPEVGLHVVPVVDAAYNYHRKKK